MRDEEFKIYDPFRRQRKKRTGVANDFTKMYQDHVDKPMVAKIVEAARRTDRRNGEWDEDRIEERAEYMDAQLRSDAANAPRGDTPFAPRDIAAKYGIDLAELGRGENKRPALWWAPRGSEERQYQEANNALGQKDYEGLMAIPERRTVPRESDIEAGGLGPGSGGGLFPTEPEKGLPEHNLIPMPRVIRDLRDLGIELPLPGGTWDPHKDERHYPHPMPIRTPGDDSTEEPPADDKIIYRPGVEPRRGQPRDGSGNNPVSGDPVFEHPGLGRMYPFPQPIRHPNEGAIAEFPMIDPGFGQIPVPDLQQLIDQISAAMENNQITAEAAGALITAVETYKPAVQDMGALASAKDAAFTGDGSNQFAVQSTDLRAGTTALQQDPGSPLQPDEDGEEGESRGDLHATIAGRQGNHRSPHGTDPNSPPDYDLKDWPGEPWDDSRAAFFKDGKKRKLSSRWGWRYRPNNPKDFHAGIDIAAGAGSEVSSIDGGVVVCPDRDADDKKKKLCRGDAVVIYDKERGVFYTYLHIVPGANINAGDTIEPGMKVGEVAGDGPPHLHYARHISATPNLRNRTDENSIDPLP